MADIAVLIIDMQDKFLEEYPAGRRDSIIRSVAGLLQASVERGYPIIAVGTIYEGPYDAALRGYVSLPGSYFVMKPKKQGNGFCNPDLLKTIRALDASTIIVSGINASLCVKETIRPMKGYGIRRLTAKDIISDVSGLSEETLSWYSQNTILFESYPEMMKNLP